jgi:hypothetical protein
VHLVEDGVEVDAIGDGGTISDIDDIGQRIGDLHDVAVGRGLRELAHLLLQQADPQSGQAGIDVGTGLRLEAQAEARMKLADRRCGRPDTTGVWHAVILARATNSVVLRAGGS